MYYTLMQNPSSGVESETNFLELISGEFLLFEVLDVSLQESWDETHVVEREEEPKVSVSFWNIS